jgi:hypothetical protein
VLGLAPCASSALAERLPRGEAVLAREPGLRVMRCEIERDKIGVRFLGERGQRLQAAERGGVLVPHGFEQGFRLLLGCLRFGRSDNCWVVI